MIGTAMFQITDSDTGLALKLAKDPKPRHPRLVEDNVFQVVTWEPGLTDPHDWTSEIELLGAFDPKTTAVFPLRTIRTRRGPVLVRAQPDDGPFIGYAFATHARLCIAFGLDKITPEILDDTMEEAEAVCLGELQAWDDFINGEVYRFEIRNRRGEIVETGRDLYGEEYARHVAQTAFDQHMMGVQTGG